MRLTINILLLGVINFVFLRNCCSQENGYGTEFHDFITRFSQEKEIQLKSISFPLTLISDNDTSFIEKKEWKLAYPCFGCEFSPILFMGDTINYLSGYYKIIGDTDYVITVYLKPEKKIQSFHFKELNNEWFLTELNLNSIKSEGPESFFEFIDKFSIDINFFEQRLAEKFKYISLDFDKMPLSEVEMPININEFKDDEFLYRRIYINNVDMQKDDVSLYIKGEGTGYHLEYYFKRINKKWYLTKLINLGV